MRKSRLIICCQCIFMVAIAASPSSSSSSELSSKSDVDRATVSSNSPSAAKSSKKMRRRKRKRSRAADKAAAAAAAAKAKSIRPIQDVLTIDDMIGDSFQVGSVFNLDYLESLHGIPSLKGKVESEKQQPRKGKKKPVEDDEEEEEDIYDYEEVDDEEPGESVKPAPFSSLPHKYETEPTSLYATHTYVDPNSELTDIDDDDRGGGAHDSKETVIEENLLARLQNMLGLKSDQKEEKVRRKKAPKKVGESNSASFFIPIKVTTTGTSAPQTTTQSHRRPKNNRFPVNVDNPFLNGNKYNADDDVAFVPLDSFVASKKLSESAPPTVRSLLLPEFLQIPSQPTFSNYGVAVDFAGTSADNPLYQQQQQQQYQQDAAVSGSVVTYKKNVVPDQVASSVTPSPPDLYHLHPAYAGTTNLGTQQQQVRPYSPNYGDAIYENQWTSTGTGQRPVVVDSVNNNNVNQQHIVYPNQNNNNNNNNGITYQNQPSYPPAAVQQNQYPQNAHHQEHGHNHHHNDHHHDHDYQEYVQDDVFQAPRPPPPSQPRPPRKSKGPKFPPSNDYEDNDSHENSQFRQFFSGQGLAGPPTKKTHGRNKNTNSAKKNKNRNKNRNKNKKRENPKTLQHLQSKRTRDKKKSGGNRNKNKSKNDGRGNKGGSQLRTPLLKLTPDGPTMPVFSSITRDVSKMVFGFLSRSRIADEQPQSI